MRQKTLGALFLLISIVLSSCEQQRISAIDESFIFSAKISVDDITLHSKVTLSLEKGNTLQPYNIAYCIDGDESLQLTDQKGNPVSGKTTESFEDFPSKTWSIPILEIGSHIITFKIKTEAYSQDIDVPFDISVAPFKIHAEVSTPESSSVSTLIINLVEGLADKDYSGKVYLDGTVIDEDGFSVNFSKTPTLMLEIPLVRPGEHVIRIEMSDGTHEENFEIRYDEPLRHPNIDIYISHDDETGHTRLMLRENPYGLFLAVRDSISVCGRCDYYETTYPDYYRKMTDYKEYHLTEDLETFIPKAGKYYRLIDKESAEKKITDAGVYTTLWQKVWRTDSEGYWDYYEVDGPFIHFKITSSQQFISAELETMQGVTVHVHCTEPGCIYNGKELTDSEYSYNL